MITATARRMKHLNENNKKEKQKGGTIARPFLLFAWERSGTPVLSVIPVASDHGSTRSRKFFLGTPERWPLSNLAC